MLSHGVTGVVSLRSLRQPNIFRTSSQQQVTPHSCQGLDFVTLNGDDLSAGTPNSVPINVLVLISVGVKIVVAFSRYAASLQRSSSEGLFFSGLSRTIPTGFQLRIDPVQRFGLLCRACL